MKVATLHSSPFRVATDQASEHTTVLVRTTLPSPLSDNVTALQMRMENVEELVASAGYHLSQRGTLAGFVVIPVTRRSTFTFRNIRHGRSITRMNPCAGTIASSVQRRNFAPIIVNGRETRRGIVSSGD